MKAQEEIFQAFGKGKANNQAKVNTAVMYTRVSTKEQADNNQSLATQTKYIKQYALNNGIEIVGEFGGTYESAKNDERKEFKRMIEFAKRKKVGNILVFSIDRFSRSGPNAIFIGQQLKQAGIKILSVTQPIDGMTAEGELQQHIYMIFGQYENQQRRQKSMAGTKEMLLRGDWPTKPPFGYEIIRQGRERRIEVTPEGRTLARAFRKKMRHDISFKELSLWLKRRGINLSHKRLSEMSRNVFYAGLMAHSALEGKVVKGSHEALITKDEFLALNKLLESKKKGPERNEHDAMLHLKGHLICSGCGCNLTGYLVKKKNLFYYKCNTVGCKHNRSARLLHGQFEDLLQENVVDPKYAAPIIEQYRRILDHAKEQNASDIKVLKTQCTQIRQKLDKLEERFVLGEVPEDLYRKYQSKYKEELAPIQAELEKLEGPLSNHEKLSQKTIQAMCNLLNIWQKCDPEVKDQFIKAIFPTGIVLERENGDYRTSGLNPAILVVSELMRDIAQTKKRNKMDLPTYSALVAGSRIELPTSGL